MCQNYVVPYIRFTVIVSEVQTDITKQFTVDDFDVDFMIDVDDIKRFGVYFKDWAEAGDGIDDTWSTSPPEISEEIIKPQTADDILFAVI